MRWISIGAALIVATLGVVAMTSKNPRFSVGYLKKKASSYFVKSEWQNASMPPGFEAVPLAERSGIVLSVRKVEVPGIEAPYNGSLIERGDEGYLLFFRYDIPEERRNRPRASYIGCMELDREFQWNGHPVRNVNTQNDRSEDARAFWKQGQIYLCYNDPSPHQRKGRVMRVGRLDVEKLAVVESVTLDPGFSEVEKNWAPFEGILEDGSSSLQFEYSLHPRILLQVERGITGVSLTPFLRPDSLLVQKLGWPISWGELRGGTPPRRVGDQFLGFFHSSFRDDKEMRWYLIGAYTFEDKPPFRITATSPHPIFFEGIYDSHAINSAAPQRKKVLFPGSFVTEERGGKRLIHLSCGENDAAIKIITIDQDALLSSLRAVTH